MSNTSPWFFWAVLSAVFAALTAIFAKIDIKGVDSDLAMLVRTGIIIVLSAIVLFACKRSNPFELSARKWLRLGLSGLATGALVKIQSAPTKSTDVRRNLPISQQLLFRGPMSICWLCGSWAAKD